MEVEILSFGYEPVYDYYAKAMYMIASNRDRSRLSGLRPLSADNGTDLAPTWR